MNEIQFEVDAGGSLRALFFPAPQKNAPIVLAIHGGAWRAGSADRYSHLGPYLAAKGIAVLAITYRPSTVAKFPAQMEDVCAGVSHLVKKADEWKLDMSRFGILGDSSGAHLAALYALGANRLAGLPDVKAMAGVYGVYDLVAQFEHDITHRTNDSITEGLLGVSAFDDRRPYFEASPLSHAVRRKNKPAFLICWGTADDVANPQSQSEAFLLALKRTGYAARSLPVVGAPHFWIDEPLDDPSGHVAFVAPKLFRFFNANL